MNMEREKCDAYASVENISDRLTPRDTSLQSPLLALPLSRITILLQNLSFNYTPFRSEALTPHIKEYEFFDVSCRWH